MKQASSAVKVGISGVSVLLIMIFIHHLIRSKGDVEVTETAIKHEIKATHKIRPDSVRSATAPGDFMEKYNQWFERNKNLLATMTGAEIKAAVHRKRTELLGQENTAQLSEMESADDHYRNLLSIFNAATHICLQKKLEVFKQAWEAISSDNLIHNYQSAFLELDSVQAELRQMNSADRAKALAVVRSAMGYAEAKIEEMAKFDAFQEEQWLKGERYMSEREKIIETYQGAERENRLRALRQAYWGAEVNIIAAEESSNFFRFKQKRIYGHN